MKTIALIDPHHLGHHYAFIRLFAKYFLKAGNRVCIIYPEKEKEIKDYLIGEGFDSSLIFFEKNSVQKKKYTGDAIWKLPLSTLMYWRDTNRLLRQTEKKHSLKFDLIFFAWLDDYLCNFLHHRFVDLVFSHNWSGLYFHPWYLNEGSLSDQVSFSSLDSVLRSRRCSSVAIHDEFNVQKLFSRIGKKIVLFPEIADRTPPQADYLLASEIKIKSNGRTIVGLIGISRRRGFFTFINTIKASDPQKFFFFFSGSPDTDFLPDEALVVNDFLSSIPSNCFYYKGYLEEGAKLNAVINTLDILFLVYTNFQSSSNYITKAALFQKLVISTNRFWMGRITTKYRLGIAVKETAPEFAAQGLLNLNDNNSKFLAEADWSGYLSVHGEEKLTFAIQEITDFKNI